MGSSGTALIEKKTKGGRGKLLPLEEVCRRLSISVATGQNWVRLGKLSPDCYDRETPCLYEDSLEQLLLTLQSNASPLLKHRRNKTQLSGPGLYRDYLEGEDENTGVVNALVTGGRPLTEEEIRLVLAEFALQLLVQTHGIPVTRPDRLLELFWLDALPLGPWGRLVADLLGEPLLYGGVPLSLKDLPRGRVTYKQGQDFLGFAYLSLRSRGGRKADGAYYTPARVARELVREVVEHCPRGRILDPCCGTGNLLLGLAGEGVAPERLYGQDIDPVAVGIARINLALAQAGAGDPAGVVEALYRRITLGDSLTEPLHRDVGAIVGNPPWGYQFSREEREALRERYRTVRVKGAESFDLFMEMALERLVPEGIVSFVLPESVLHVRSHEKIRKILLEKAQISRVDYLGNVFNGVLCPAIVLTATRRDGASTACGIRVVSGENSFVIRRERELKSGGFRLNVTDEEYLCLKKLDSLPGKVTLEGRADFALGVVTGDNRRYVRREPEPGWEPVLKGSDLVKFRTLPPGQYLKYEPARFQQVAPDCLYRAEEKLLYRFVGESLVFSYDDRGTLSLNSCNILIPRVEGLSIKYILAVLNSRAAQFYCGKQFSSLKRLRSHIEQIPIPPADSRRRKAVEELVDEILWGTGPVGPLYEKLDRRIMDLFGLDPRERRLIRQAVKGVKLYLEK